MSKVERYVVLFFMEVEFFVVVEWLVELFFVSL